MIETCAVCRFFLMLPGQKKGVCRRYPATIFLTGAETDSDGTLKFKTLTIFPEMMPEGWCGEWALGSRAGYVPGENTQHCVGAIIMFLKDGNDCGWPGIDNDEDLAAKLAEQVDWSAPVFESEADFIAASAQRPKRKRKAA